MLSECRRSRARWRAAICHAFWRASVRLQPLRRQRVSLLCGPPISRVTLRQRCMPLKGRHCSPRRCFYSISPAAPRTFCCVIRFTLRQHCLQPRGNSCLLKKFCCSIFPAVRRICCSAIRCVRSRLLAPVPISTPDRLWIVWGSNWALGSRRVLKFPVWLRSAGKRSGRSPV